MPINKVYQIPEDEFIKKITNSKNISSFLREYNILGCEQFYYRKIRQRCKEFNILPPPNYRTTKKQENINKNEIPDNNIIDACLKSISRRETLKKLGLNYFGSNILWINKKIKDLNINISHWLGQGYLKDKTHNWNKKIPIEELLVDSRYQTNANTLKKRLIKEKILENKCNSCFISEWKGKPIILHLHHINGNHDDNRLENLQLLCPNCHSQTDNFCGKNIERPPKQEKNKTPKIKKTLESSQYFCSCGSLRDKNSKLCLKCFHKTLEKINWPSDEELFKMASEMNYLELSRKLGISDNAIRHRLKRRGFIPPSKYK